MPLQPFTIPSDFVPTTAPKELPEAGMLAESLPAIWFICEGSCLVVMEEGSALPRSSQLSSLGIVAKRTQFLGYLGGVPCVGVAVQAATELSSLPDGLTLTHLRKLHGVLPEKLFAIAARAIQIMEWDRTHQYCGHCATMMTQLPSERAKRCPQCQLRQYPRLSPAVIMLIYRGEEILLARAPRFRDGMYSVLAGFVEPGESLEETVARETKEEVGVEIKNIRYFGSQPWPFPNSLMVGFTAEYANGVITPEPGEIEEAAWFRKDNLPPVPGKLSIARKLIDWFVTQ